MEYFGIIAISIEVGLPDALLQWIICKHIIITCRHNLDDAGLFLDAYAVPPPAQKSPVTRFGSGRVAVDLVGVLLAPVTEHDRLEGGVQRPPVKDVLWVGLYLTSCIHSFGCRDAMDSRFGRLAYWSN
ncbi:hypothetical protein CDAR_532411 [Caerostris darwini]|uniref:Uncharacterized protein n=1 Tax=Caerostris darwini TaxID=1538125 RepID=A0AAV4Q874_9ARAC|nr:hypothetical protein CDAR_532411 [Caerostris darwini]